MRYFENRGNLHLATTIESDILELNFVDLGSEWNYKGVVSSFTRIYFPTSGSGVVWDGDRKIDLLPGKLYVIPAYTKFSCECESLTKYYAHVSVLRSDGIDVFGEIGRVLECDDDGYTDALDTYSKSGTVKSLMMIRETVFGALNHVCNTLNIDLGSNREYSNIVIGALRYVNENLSASLKIAEIADSLSVASVTLQKHFVKEIGMPIGNYIDQKIMTEAERLLIDGNLNVGEIAEKLGFCDRFYFSRKFAMRFGVSPKKYLKHRAT